MGIECERWQWRDLFASEHGPPDPSTRLVLFVIALYVHEDGSQGFPSQKTIAARTRLSERTVRTHISLAEKAGWLRISSLERPGKRAWFIHQYVATIPEPLAQFLKSKPWEKDPPRAAMVAGRSPEQAANGARHPAIPAGTPGNGCSDARQPLPPNSSSDPPMNKASECAESVLKKWRKRSGATTEEDAAAAAAAARRERKYDREIKAGGLSEEPDE